MSKLQILNYFPSASLKKVHSWKNIKQLIATTKDDDKIFEIGNDNSSKQHVNQQQHEKKMSTKRYEKAAKSSNQPLYDIVKLRKVSNTNQDLTSVVFNMRPDSLRARNEGLTFAKELGQNERKDEPTKCWRTIPHT